MKNYIEKHRYWLLSGKILIASSCSNTTAPIDHTVNSNDIYSNYSSTYTQNMLDHYKKSEDLEEK